MARAVSPPLRNQHYLFSDLGIGSQRRALRVSEHVALERMDGTSLTKRIFAQLSDAATDVIRLRSSPSGGSRDQDL